MPKAKAKVRRGYRKRTTKRKYKRKASKSVRGRKKRGRKPSAAAQKRKAKAKRRVKAINKTIARVRTKLKDEHVSMRRMYLKTRSAGRDNDTLDAETDLRQFTYNGQEPTDGELVNNQNLRIPVKYDDWFQINNFHGYCMPRGLTSQISSTSAYDPMWERYDQWINIARWFAPERVGISENEYANQTLKLGLDIMAYRQIEIPYVPCIPSAVENQMSINPRPPRGQLDHYTRDGDMIKVTQNYLRFNFYVSSDERFQKYSYMAGTNYENQSESGVVTSVVNTPKQYSVTAPRFAKARIIIVKRKKLIESPIVLDDFLKQNDPYIMGDELHRMSKYFHRGRKTKADYLLQNAASRTETTALYVPPHATTDTESRNYSLIPTSDQELLNDVAIVYDKVHRLKMNSETTVKITAMKGKVLHYKPNPGRRETVVDNGVPGNIIQNTNIAIDELSPGNQILPISTNAAWEIHSGNALNQAKAFEYCPEEQYACFLMLQNVRCTTEYSVFQKFDYDT